MTITAGARLLIARFWRSPMQVVIGASFLCAFALLAWDPASSETPETATERPGDPLYLSLSIGATESNDPKGSDGVTSVLTAGVAANAAVGYAFESFRAEAELGYHINFLDDQTVGGVSRATTFQSPFLVGLRGELETLSFMGNAYVDIPAGETIKPYLGAGLGVAYVSAEYEATESFLFLSRRLQKIVDDSDTVLAYQGIAGISWALWPRTDLLTEYRFFATGDPEFTDFTGNSIEVEGQEVHALLIGMRIH